DAKDIALDVLKEDDPDEDATVMFDVTTDKSLSVAGNQKVALIAYVEDGNEKLVFPLAGAGFEGTNKIIRCSSGTSCFGGTFVKSAGVVQDYSKWGNGSNYQFAAFYTPGTTLRIGFNIKDLCFVENLETPDIEQCDGGVVSNPNKLLSLDIKFEFRVVDPD